MDEIKKTELEIYELTRKLNTLRQDREGAEVPDYEFKTLSGTTTLKSLFAGRDKLMLIHNMGQGCRYCTLWADGLNPFLPHLESVMSVVLVSRDDPESQRRMANDRGWRFRTASHGGGKYIQEQSVQEGQSNYPGVVLYVLKGGKILRKNATAFGPYDQFCSAWNFLSLAGLDEESWTPQFRYWKRPEKMDDGGQNLRD